jgi:phosphoribosylformylglycinamidine synthase
MWQLSECIDGMAEACRAFSLPVIGGNVSLYNESAGADIDPTPVLGLLGLVETLHAPPPGLAWQEADTLVLLGPRAAAGGSFPLDATRWATERRQHRGGTLPDLDVAGHAAVCAFVAGLVAAIVAGGHDSPVLRAVHDVSSGGLAVTLAEMAVAAGTGCAVALEDPAELFTELPSRFVVATPEPDELAARAKSLGIPCSVLGRAGADRVTLGDLVDLPLASLRQAYEGNLARLLGDS